MADTLEINLCGRIMLGVRRHGVSDPRRVAVLARAVAAAIDSRYPDGRPSLLVLEPVITEQLALLEAALVSAEMRRALGAEEAAAPPVVPEEGGRGAAQEGEERRLRRRTLKGRGHTVVAPSMDEKLRAEREPVQELLEKDCVELGLIDRKQAQRLIRGMIGKRSEDAEREIVEHLRQVLQNQVKGIVRRLKGGPWANPRAQEELRQDIHHVRSVKGLLMLTRQVIKERREWEKTMEKVVSSVACSVPAGDWAHEGSGSSPAIRISCRAALTFARTGFSTLAPSPSLPWRGASASLHCGPRPASRSRPAPAEGWLGDFALCNTRAGWRVNIG